MKQRNRQDYATHPNREVHQADCEHQKHKPQQAVVSFVSFFIREKVQRHKKELESHQKREQRTEVVIHSS